MLLISFGSSLPRPWWALLTVYVTAQPMSGAFRPKIAYRLVGIALGATVTIILVPMLQSSPPLLVLCLAAWTGGCIYLAVLDRTPRAFLFQMAAFSSAVMSFPYLDDPGQIFVTTISRVEEMTVAILCVSVAHGLLQPWSATPIIRARAERFLVDGSRWTAEAIGGYRLSLEYEHRRRLAADVAELGMIAIHLPFDQVGATATHRLVRKLQERLSTLLPAATAAADRRAVLQHSGPLDARLNGLIDEIVQWLNSGIDTPHGMERPLIRRCRAMSTRLAEEPHWRSLVAASLCERMAELVEAHRDSRLLTQQLRGPLPVRLGGRRPFPIARDHGLAALAGLATAAALILYCAVWILLAWPSGSATAAFAALITCSFATQDDPAPVIERYLNATLATFPLTALYLFVILPRVDGAAMLIVVLAPALLAIGYLQADASRSARALPMFSCFIVGLGFLDRFTPDFAAFINTGLAQVGGIVATIAITRLFRSVGVRWTARRMVRANWRDLERLASSNRPLDPAVWTGRATDRLGQIAARMALTPAGDALHAADGLGDLRIGRNIIRLRRATRVARGVSRERLDHLLAELATLFRARASRAFPVAPSAPMLAALDQALSATAAMPKSRVRRQARLALVGMRCNLFPSAAAYEASPAQ